MKPRAIVLVLNWKDQDWDAEMIRLLLCALGLLALTGKTLAAEARNSKQDIQISGNEWSNGHCTNLSGVGVRIPVTFFSEPTAQELRIDHVMRPYSKGPYCGYMLAISDASNPTTGGQIAALSEVVGPGLVFSDFHWHRPSVDGQINIKFLHIYPLARSQVLITDAIKDGANRATRLDLWVSNNMNQPVDLVHIASPEPISLDLDAKGFSITGTQFELKFALDLETQQLELRNPTAQNIAIFKQLEANADSLPI